MPEILSLFFIFAFVFLGYQSEKKLKEKSERSQWLYRESERFHTIALDYDKKCKEYIDKVFPQHNRAICNHRKGTFTNYETNMMFFENSKHLEKITDLRTEYLQDYPQKYEARYGMLYVENYTDYIFNDYKNEIDQIYDHYRYIVWLMREQIMEMQPNSSV